MADWLLEPPRARLTIRQGLLWLIFPVGWIAYTMIRGGLVGLYPYPFLDPANGGYATVALYCVGILGLMAIVCCADGRPRECGRDEPAPISERRGGANGRLTTSGVDAAGPGARADAQGQVDARVTSRPASVGPSVSASVAGPSTEPLLDVLERSDHEAVRQLTPVE